MVASSAGRATALPTGAEESPESPEIGGGLGGKAQETAEKPADKPQEKSQIGQDAQEGQELAGNSGLSAASSVEAAFGQDGSQTRKQTGKPTGDEASERARGQVSPQTGSHGATGATGAVFSGSGAIPPSSPVLAAVEPPEAAPDGGIALGAGTTSQVVAFPVREPTAQPIPQPNTPPTPQPTPQPNEPASGANGEPAKGIPVSPVGVKPAKASLTKIQSKDALRGIREAAQEIGVEPHVLRFWETRFSALKPIKHAGGRRLYRPQDMELLRRIYALLREDGMTIKGAAKVIGNRAGRAEAKNDSLRIRANEILHIADELESLFK